MSTLEENSVAAEIEKIDRDLRGILNVLDEMGQRQIEKDKDIDTALRMSVNSGCTNSRRRGGSLKARVRRLGSEKQLQSYIGIGLGLISFKRREPHCVDI